jgi:hypothetical protein
MAHGTRMRSNARRRFLGLRRVFSRRVRAVPPTPGLTYQLVAVPGRVIDAHGKPTAPGPLATLTWTADNRVLLDRGSTSFKLTRDLRTDQSSTETAAGRARLNPLKTQQTPGLILVRQPTISPITEIRIS